MNSESILIVFDGELAMEIEKPCIHNHTCGFEYCNMTDCPYYEPKTKGKKWWEKEDKDGKAD